MTTTASAQMDLEELVDEQARSALRRSADYRRAVQVVRIFLFLLVVLVAGIIGLGTGLLSDWALAAVLVAGLAAGVGTAMYSRADPRLRKLNEQLKSLPAGENLGMQAMVFRDSIFGVPTDKTSGPSHPPQSG